MAKQVILANGAPLRRRLLGGRPMRRPLVRRPRPTKVCVVAKYAGVETAASRRLVAGRLILGRRPFTAPNSRPTPTQAVRLVADGRTPIGALDIFRRLAETSRLLNASFCHNNVRKAADAPNGRPTGLEGP